LIGVVRQKRKEMRKEGEKEDSFEPEGGGREAEVL
jgi:hypothetical protein